MNNIDEQQQQYKQPKTVPGFFIVQLNLVDYLTLSGVVLVSASIVCMLNKEFEIALSLLYLAVIADAFDGILARKLNTVREFGRYLDGFVDCLDYLVAPAFFVYLWGFDAWYQGILLIILIMAGIIRLSVFNQVGNISNEENKLSYWGAPVFWSVLVLGPLYLLGLVFDKNVLFVFLSIAILLFSVAMLHNGRYYKFKNPVVMLVGLASFSILFLILGYQPILTQLITALLAIFPLTLAGILHMVIVKNNILSVLAKPIQTHWFGASKTWRGVIMMPVFTIAGFYVMLTIVDSDVSIVTFDLWKYNFVQLGLVMGLTYIIAELPNSFMKRRLGVAPGELPEKNRVLFVLADQFDSIVGCGLVYMWWLNMPWESLVFLLLLGLLVALLIKRILYRFGYKKTKT